jgi:hypothetical protein
MEPETKPKLLDRMKGPAKGVLGGMGVGGVIFLYSTFQTVAQADKDSAVVNERVSRVEHRQDKLADRMDAMILIQLGQRDAGLRLWQKTKQEEEAEGSK